MSKIMRETYAEALAAREAKANPSDKRARDAQSAASSRLEVWSLPVSNPVASAGTTIDWWIKQVAEAAAHFPRSDALVESLLASTSSGVTAIDPRFPLGAPLNRAAKPPLRSIPGRPNWFVDSRGAERYIEPARSTLLRRPVSREPS